MLTEQPTPNLVAVIEINSIARNFLSSVLRNVYCEIEILECNRKPEERYLHPKFFKQTSAKKASGQPTARTTQTRRASSKTRC
jgi:hypothetical protein